MPAPSASTARSIRATAIASPRWSARSQTPLVRRVRPRCSSILNRSVCSPRLTSFFARASIATRPAYASTQPRRPHGQRAPSRFTTMCPISPEAPRPSHGLPSRMIPPPTPLPQKTPSSDEKSLPAPRANSAPTATWTSLPMTTLVPSFSASACAKRELAVPAGQVRRPRDGAGDMVNRSRRANADAAQCARLDARRCGGLAHRTRELGDDVGRPAAHGCRSARLSADLVGIVHDDRLHFGAAEVEAAFHHAGKLTDATMSRRNRW